MKYAAAMKYGGELISAIECNYDSFKQLVPLCPNCKEPVYLRAGGDRLSSKGKPYKVGAHWCHFKGVSDEQIASCESRVNSYSEKDKQRIAAKARGQRLKLLQRWFWKVLWSTIHEVSPQELETISPYLGGSRLSRIFEAKNEIGDTFRAAAEQIQGMNYDQFWVDTHALDSVLSENKTFAFQIWNIAQHYEQKRKLCSVDFHCDLTFEALGFLRGKRNRQLLNETIFIAAVMRDVDNRSAGINQFPNAEQVADSFIGLLFSVPWFAEFQRLEAESQSRIAS